MSSARDDGNEASLIVLTIYVTFMPNRDMSDGTAPATRIGFLLIDGFSMMAYASIAEPFRAANELSGRALYRWIHYSDDGIPARASNGVRIAVDSGPDHDAQVDILFVCASGNPARYRKPVTRAWLRGLAGRRVQLGGVSGGAYILARSGLLDGYRCTIHWEHRAAFIEEFPRLAITESLYVMDRDRLTCAGGTAGLDLAIAMIEAAHGRQLATAVSDWYIRTQFRDAAAEQRHSLRERLGTPNTVILATVAVMEANLESPLSREELAAREGISLRQLERLFARHRQRTIAAEYRSIRLHRARSLLRETDLNASEVAVATGFASFSHFSRAFRSEFGLTPTECRARAWQKSADGDQAGNACAISVAARR